jgi:hypothetical protein
MRSDTRDFIKRKYNEDISLIIYSEEFDSLLLKLQKINTVILLQNEMILTRLIRSYEEIDRILSFHIEDRILLIIKFSFEETE